MPRRLALILGLLFAVACASTPHVEAERTLSLRVAGFVQAEGIT